MKRIIATAVIAAGLFTIPASADTTCPTYTGAFGWEADSLHGNGANLVLPVTSAMHVTFVTVDYSMTRVPSKPDGWREALAYLAFNPTGTTGPAWQPTNNGSPGWGASTRNGTTSHGGGMTDGTVAQAILKNGYSGAVITQPLDVTLQPGNTVWVHADAYGAWTDVEAQGSLTYALC